MTPSNRRRLPLAIAVAALALVAVVIGSATSLAANSSGAAKRWNQSSVLSTQGVRGTEAGSEPQIRRPIWKTLVLTEQYSDKLTFVDVGTSGDSVGDYAVFRDPVVNKAGQAVGTIDVQCMIGYADMCHGSIRIPGRGQITFDGITPASHDPDHFAVTGGTGTFAGVGGVLRIDFPDQNSAQLTVLLTR